MKDCLLALDCSNRWSCLGLMIDGALAGSVDVDLGRRQASQLPVRAEELLASAGLAFGDLTLLAVTVGPGYFTGIRIGMAYAAAFAFALGLNVVPLSSLEVVLRSSEGWDRGLKAPLIAASREAVFSGAWQDGHRVLEEAERSREELVAALSAISSDFEMIAVDDVRLFASSVRDGVTLLEHPRGAAAASLAWERRNESIGPERLRARYLREPGLGRA